MSQLCRKNREIKTVDYDQEVERFLASGKVAFIPDEQRDTYRPVGPVSPWRAWHSQGRDHWHCVGEKVGIATKTIKIWQEIGLCGMHHRPIIGMKPSTDFGSQCPGTGPTGDSDYECDYECNDEDGCIGNCCYLEHKHQKLRTVVIFNKEAASHGPKGPLETSEKIKNMDLTEIKDFLAEAGIIKNDKGRYSK